MKSRAPGTERAVSIETGRDGGSSRGAHSPPSKTGAPAILLFTELYPPAVGGSPVLFESVYSRLGLATTVLTDAGRSPGPPEERQGAVRIVRQLVAQPGWGVLDPRMAIRYVRNALRLRALARAPRTLVHCGRVLPEGLAALLARVLGGPRYVVWTHGEELSYEFESRELGVLMRAVYRHAAAVIANSRNTARILAERGVPPDRIHVAHPGVDPDRFKPGIDGAADLRRRFASDGEVVLLSVGRLQLRKGHDLAIAAVARLRDEVPGLRYVIAGDGAERPRLEALARDQGVAGRVIFAGEVKSADLPAYYAASDVFLLPNRVVGAGDIEGFGIVFLEAAAAERPTIGGATGGVPEAVAAGETGLLIGGTDADELAAAIRALATPAETRRRLGRAGRARVLRSFTWDRTAEAVAALHARLARPGGRRPRTRAPRVLQVCLSLGPGGTERLVIEIAKRLDADFPMAVVCLDERGAWAKELTERGIPVEALGRRAGFRPGLGRAIARLAARHRATVLHCHHYTPFVYGRIAAYLGRSPRPGVVFTEHGRLSDAPPSRKRQLANAVLGRLPSRIFAVSEDLRHHMVAEGFPEARVGVIQNGIDLGPAPGEADRARARETLGLAPTTFAVGTVARLDPVKDLGTLIEGFAAFARGACDAVLVIAGDGPLRDRLRALAQESGAGERVRFLGHRDDVRRLLPALDVFANTSTHEGVSLTILEAMAAALPVIATRVGGNPEVVAEGETGALVGARDPGAVTRALSDLAAGAARRLSQGAAGRRRVEERFSLNSMLGKYSRLYWALSGGAAILPVGDSSGEYLSRERTDVARGDSSAETCLTGTSSGGRDGQEGG